MIYGIDWDTSALFVIRRSWINAHSTRICYTFQAFLKYMSIVASCRTEVIVQITVCCYCCCCHPRFFLSSSNWSRTRHCHQLDTIAPPSSTPGDQIYLNRSHKSRTNINNWIDNKYIFNDVIGKCHKSLKINLVYFVLVLEQFHSMKAMNQPPFFEIKYWRSYRPVLSRKLW